MPDQPSPRRRFQFRMRTLMIVVGIVAAICAYISHERQVVQERQKLVESLPLLPRKVFNADPRLMTEISWIRRCCVGRKTQPRNCDSSLKRTAAIP
jgi:membrane carboxypeptidase/penicillin-binding protein